MATAKELSQLISEIYAAAERPDLWTAFLETLLRQLNGTTANLLLYDQRRRGGAVGYQAGAHTDRAWEYRERWSKYDVWGQSGHPLLRAEGAVYSAAELAPDGLVLRSAIYNEYYRPQGVFAGAVATVAFREGLTAAVTCNFSYEQGHPSRAKLDLLGLLTPHLQRAVALQQRLQEAQADSASLDELLDRMPIGFCLLAEDGRLLRASRAAEALFSRQDGLQLRDGRLCSAGGALEAAIRAALRGTARPGDSAGAELRILKTGPGSPYEVAVTPLSTEGGLFGRLHGYCAVLIHDPDAAPIPDQRRLAAELGLTPTEAEVCAELLLGLDVAETAERLGKTANTVRAHMKSIYGKSGVRSRAALLRKLSTSLAAWGRKPAVW